MSVFVLGMYTTSATVSLSQGRRHEVRRNGKELVEHVRRIVLRLELRQLRIVVAEDVA